MALPGSLQLSHGLGLCRNLNSNKDRRVKGRCKMQLFNACPSYPVSAINVIVLLVNLAAVPSFIRRHPIVTTAVSYLGISYAARPLIRHFNTDEQNANADDHLRPFRATDVFYPGRMLGRVMFSMIDRHVNVRETEEAIVLRYCGLSDVKKKDVKVFVDRNILKIEDTFPGRNRFSGTLDLVEKNCDGLHTTAKFENDVLEVVIPKKRKKNKEEDEDEVDVDLIVLHVIVE